MDHIRDTLECGNEMYVQFRINEPADKVLSYLRVYDTGYDDSVFFTLAKNPLGDILLEHIEDFEFVQYRPQTEWKAIHMGSIKRINLEQFEETWVSDTFRHLHPTIVLHNCQFWHVMGLKLMADDGEVGWYLYLKRRESDVMTRVKMPLTQKFIYNPVSNSWFLDDLTEEITDIETREKTYLLDHVKAMHID